ncbi:MAG: tetratricopeptide repeat protein, partial [Bacteroidota bacterium]
LREQKKYKRSETTYQAALNIYEELTTKDQSFKLHVCKIHSNLALLHWQWSDEGRKAKFLQQAAKHSNLAKKIAKMLTDNERKKIKINDYESVKPQPIEKKKRAKLNNETINTKKNKSWSFRKFINFFKDD